MAVKNPLLFQADEVVLSLRQCGVEPLTPRNNDPRTYVWKGYQDG